MAISVFDLFSIGIGPSSSHTVGPMKAARTFADDLRGRDLLTRTAAIKTELYGSLGATGKGHGSDKAVMLGLEGIRQKGQLKVLGEHPVSFDEKQHLVMHRRRALPFHPNGMRFTAFAGGGEVLHTAVYYSIGGGFVVNEASADGNPISPDTTPQPYAFKSGAELLRLCNDHGLSISALMMENEKVWRSESEIREKLLAIWSAMQKCVENGCQHDGILPGGMKVKRRAARLYRQLNDQAPDARDDPLHVMDWVNLYALAVNEENAAGGRVVTAPTNGAAGIIPAVLHYYREHRKHADDDGIVRFLLTAGAIGILYKENASISGAEVGCQGEVGSACSMAAAGLAEVFGGTPHQVENAAEIAMEHNLGLTCDPIGGLVQVPCIERNAIASVKAINSARMAMRGDGEHFVSLDKVIKTMRDTGADMKTKYKETARGGLAINVLEIPVSVVEC
jgi:L-serine dehydratase